MMETKHTPGPWKIVGRAIMEDGSVYPTHLTGGSDDHQVCSLESPAIADVAIKNPEQSWWGIKEANARLIAAAPELLEALISLHAVAFTESDSDYGAVAKAATAIAKATGAA